MCWQDDDNPYQELHDANKAIDRLNIKIRKLESEADWLARRLEKICNTPDTHREVRKILNAQAWREAACKAIEEKANA